MQNTSTMNIPEYAIDRPWDSFDHSKQEDDLGSEKESEFPNKPVDLSRKNFMTSTRTDTIARSSRSSSTHRNYHSSPTRAQKRPSSNNVVLSSSYESDPPKETTEGCEMSTYVKHTADEIRNNNSSFILSRNPTMDVPFTHSLLSWHQQEEQEERSYPSNVIKIPVATSAVSTITPSYVRSSLQTDNGIPENPGLFDFLNRTSSLPQVETSSSSDAGKKLTSRPFKAYSKSAFSFHRQIDPVLNMNSKKFLEYRERMLNYKKSQENASNPKMRRTSKSPGLPTSTADEKDAAYWERRRKNNEAAKRSRDARRAKEDELAIWASYLEEENKTLKNNLSAAYFLLQKLGYDVNNPTYKLW